MAILFMVVNPHGFYRIHIYYKLYTTYYVLYMSFINIYVISDIFNNLIPKIKELQKNTQLEILIA